MWPLNDAGAMSGLVCGVLFGYVLENAGFGSPCKLTAQFSMRDWSVFKVMFTAIVVAATGLYALELAGLLAIDNLFVPTSLVMASAVGGVLIGWSLGLSVGGTTLLAVLYASASYIAAPAAMRIAIPEANPALSMGVSLGVTFPFNLLVGIPLYHAMAEHLYRIAG